MGTEWQEALSRLGQSVSTTALVCGQLLARSGSEEALTSDCQLEAQPLTGFLRAKVMSPDEACMKSNQRLSVLQSGSDGCVYEAIHFHPQC